MLRVQHASTAFVLLALLSSSGSLAIQNELRPDLAPLVLSETVPFTFVPNDYAAADYRLEWSGAPVPGVKFRLGEESLDWVRVLELLNLPRAVVLIEVEDAQGGMVSSAGFGQPLLHERGRWTARLPVALISGPDNPIELTVRRGSREIKGTLNVRLAPRPENASQILYDPTCSPFRVSAESSGGRPDEFLYFGCRLVHTKGEEYPVATLELFVFWDNVGQTIEIEGVKRAASSVSVWPVRLRSRPGTLKLKAGDHDLTVRYSIPERTRRAFLGLGVGPYGYTFQNSGADVNAVAPLTTLYGSYFLSEDLRVVTFNATAIHKNWFTNQGVYLWTEQMRVFDSRFSLVLLFGAHVLGFSNGGTTYLRFGGPQGIEVTFRDFLLRRHDVNFGIFMQPPIISDRFYYNSWVRWGNPELFLEFNYISWLEQIRHERIYTRSIGLTVGFPLARFL